MRLSVLVLALAFLVVHQTQATIYDVGPSYSKTRLRDVPWDQLNPGDVVNIHTTPGGYHEIIQVSRTGTAAQHIVIHGVPDPVTGALPVLDGKDAIEDTSVDWRASLFSQIGIIVVSPKATVFATTGGYGTFHISFIDIENLDIRNALYTSDNSITLTDQHGLVKPWDDFACGIYIEWAHDLAIRGCEISYCCNGIFANSKNGSAMTSQRLLIEHNYFHDNSLPLTVNPADASKIISNGYHEHHCYIEAAGVTYQYNHFGPLRANCHGVAIKDRSSGQIIRYNEFDMLEESNVFALLDPQGGGVIESLPDYKDSYIYGNLITIQSFTSPMSMVWWGAYNGPASYASQKRGVLHFYHNTIVSHKDRLALFFLPSTNYTGGAMVNETLDCRDNVFYSDSSVQSSIYTAMTFSTGGATNGGGNITLGRNWISPGWQKDNPGHAYEGLLLGTNNLLLGDAQGANNPHFVNTATRDYHVLTGSNIIDAATALGAGDPPVLEEYVSPQSSITRSIIGGAFDLGAVESTGTPPPPPAGGALAFSAITYTVAENALTATVTVNRTGGSTGAVSVVCSSTGGTATSPADFTAGASVLTWADGDTTSQPFSVPIFNDTSTELAETINLNLSNITGGAGYGPITQATLTINDDDIPPSQPIIAITGLGSLIRFTSGAPGTIISNVAVTGINSPQTMRGLAFRRSTGQLYVMGAEGGTSNVNATLYLLNPATAVLTPIASMTLAHPSFDLGFDPVTDQLHLFGSTGQNIRLDPTTGAVIASDTALAFVAGDVHAGATPGIVGADYTPGFAPTVYAIDKTLDILVRVGSPGGSPLGASSGALSTVGPLGKDSEGLTGLDFTPGGTAFAVLNSATDATSNLYVVDTGTGHATSLGTIGVAETVRDIVVATPGQISMTSSTADVTESDGSITLNIARTGGSWGSVSVTCAASNGTATSGSDYSFSGAVLTWLDGEVGTKSIVVSIGSDSVVEGDETFSLTLSNSTGGALFITPTSTMVTIHERPYDVWKNIFFGSNANVPTIGGDGISPAHDRVPNLAKYALGMNPTKTSALGLPVIDFADGHQRLSFTRIAPDVEYQVEVSDDLINWTPGSSYGIIGTVPSNAVTTDITPANSPAGFTQVQDNTTAPGASKHFMRLKVLLP
ncbi:MAG: hypothetical protein JWO08_1119 [Verrucomicrobiaceae bacterium]|nr:hypothetical protein [Verrucomicrobiaceae bacterium]